MDLKAKLREIGQDIKDDPGVREGVLQALVAAGRIVLLHITQPELRPPPVQKKLPPHK